MGRRRRRLSPREWLDIDPINGFPGMAVLGDPLPDDPVQ
jgi:hypothetical protein